MSAAAIYRSTLTVFACGALAAFSPRHVFAQSDARTRADSLVRDGDLAANDSRPRAAIDAYERAIAVDPSRRVALLPRLGRQDLWSDAPRQAARLFTDYLATNPTSCETKLDLGLALSWANELDAAARVDRDGTLVRIDRRARA